MAAATKARAADNSTATTMWQLAARCKERLLANLIATEEGETIDPQIFVDDANGAGVSFGKVALVSDTLHARRLRQEEHTGLNLDEQCDRALEESREAQAASVKAQAAAEAARIVASDAGQRATAAVQHSSAVQARRKDKTREYSAAMQADAGPGDPFDWRNVAF